MLWEGDAAAVVVDSASPAALGAAPASVVCDPQADATLVANVLGIWRVLLTPASLWTSAHARSCEAALGQGNV